MAPSFTAGFENTLLHQRLNELRLYVTGAAKLRQGEFRLLVEELDSVVCFFFLVHRFSLPPLSRAG